MSDFWEVRIQDVAEVLVSNVDKKSYAGQQAVVLCNYMDVYSNDYISSDLNFMDSTASEAEIKKFSLRKGDVVITKDSESPFDIGIPSVVVEDIDNLVCGYHLAIIRPNLDKVDPLFLAKQLSSEKSTRYFARVAAGSTRFGLSVGSIHALPIQITFLEVQKKIGGIGLTIDNQIDITQALIDKYTAIKQGMITDLFSRGIDPETKALRPTIEEAPELYHKTSLGMLPKGWDVTKLQSVATVERGKFTHRPRDDKRCFGGKHPFIQTGDVATCVGNYLTQYKQTLSDFGRSVSKEFPAGTVAVTIAANIADTAILAMPMCFPDSVVGVVVDERLSSSRFVELCIRMSKAKLDALAPQSAQKNINLEDLRPLKIRFPSRVEQELICASYEAINDPVNSLINEKKKLIVQKAGLMQDLLTGKVSVTA